MVNRLCLDGKWELTPVEHEEIEAQSDGYPIEALVPGDVHADLLRAGKIENPYYGDNIEKIKWTTRKDWYYRRTFKLPKNFLRLKTELVFDGIDTYGTVWLNGVEIGKTENMFRQYRFDVTDHVKPGENELVVKIGATIPIIESFDPKEYFACFYVPRIFVRKAQCQFSWDWAPHLPALGIWQSVWLESSDHGRITDVCVRPSCDGRISFFVETDQRRLRQDLDGRVDRGRKFETGVPAWDIVVEVSGHGQKVKKTVRLRGQKNHLTLTLKDPKLWWPNGLGEPNLYDYKVSLVDGRTVLESRKGRFGVREVELIEEPNPERGFSFRFRINGQNVFCKGANWVPADCFPGTVTDDKYRYLIRLAKEANFNMLRIWGGGIYEKDIFYDLCDEHGIMVWQDFMFACSDYPDDQPWFVDLVIPEIQYQVRRLRNHPSLVYWCGGNEKTGSAGFKIHYGEKIYHTIIAGICADLDPTRPYHPASPYSLSDLGNDMDSGDTHRSCYEDAFRIGIEHFRDEIAKIQTVFNSEFGLHGPVLFRSLVKFIPAEYLTPPNPVWELHVQDNPYNSLAETFSEVQMKVAERLFGPFKDVKEFIKFGTTSHSEILREEFENHRRRKYANSGAMFWMFADTWPCGSWSVVDYYGLPKPAYYAAKRACQPVLPSFKRDGDQYGLYLISDLRKPIAGTLTFGQMSVEGKILWQEKRGLKIPADSSVSAAAFPAKKVRDDPKSFLFAIFRYGRSDARTTWFPNLWRAVAWPDPGISLKVLRQKKVGSVHFASVQLHAKRYGRCVNLSVPDENAIFSDNFFDMLPGEKRIVTIESAHPFDARKIRADHWGTVWE